MYFIARNNKIYNYIAHTRPLYRYIFTGSLSCLIIFVHIFFLHTFLEGYLTCSTQEHKALQKKYKEVYSIFIQAKQDADVAWQIVNALEHKKRALENLSKLSLRYHDTQAHIEVSFQTVSI